MHGSPIKRVFSVIAFAVMWIVAAAASACAGDWLTFGHDPQRSGWAEDETELSPKTVSALELQWKVTVNNKFYSLSALTAPVGGAQIHTTKGVRSVIYVAGIGGGIFALDARTGEQLWTRTLRATLTARKGGLEGTFLCPEGITATPVIDKESGVLYTIAADGALYGLDLGSGAVRYGPVQFIAPFSKSWSLNLVQGNVFTTVSLGCGNGRSGVYAMDIQDPRRPIARQALLSKAYTAGIWGRGGPVIGKNGKVYGGTADGDTNPEAGDYSSTVVAVSQSDLSVADYFMPRNWGYLKKADLDIGSASPVWFTWNNHNLLAHGSKEGVVYLMDADNLGGKDHQTALFTSTRLGNEDQSCCEGAGIWGGLSASRDEEGQTWVYVPMGGAPAANGPKFPRTNGDNHHGSIMSFKVVSDPKTGNPVLDPAWISGDFNLPDPIAIANGVLFALSTGENPVQHGDESKRFLNTHPAMLKALDAHTGKELYNSGASMTSWVHFSGLAIVDGRVYAVDHDSNVYCFGVGAGAKGVQTSSLDPRSVMSNISGHGSDDELSRSWIGMVDRQDDFFKTWVVRTEVGLGLGLIAAVIGLWAGAKSRST
jgi:outer membrane protein assembly factor BamB